MGFIHDIKDRREPGGLRWGVEPMCAVLTQYGITIAPSTYYEWVGKQPTARERRDEELAEMVTRVFTDNFSVYGARKVWLALRREGVEVARCTVERLMRALGLRGAHRGLTCRTTIADDADPLACDLVHRHFAPAAPNRLWVADA